MAYAKKGLGRGLSALIPTDMDFLAEVARGDFSVLATPGASSTAETSDTKNVSRATVAGTALKPLPNSPQAASSGPQERGRVRAGAHEAAHGAHEAAHEDASAADALLQEAATPRAAELPAMELLAIELLAGAAAVPGGQDGRGGRDQVRWVAPGQVVANPYQPRRTFDEAELSNLADSIREHGVLQPIIVRPLDMGWGFELDAEPTGGKLQLIAGERRWRAAQAAGLARVPVIVREVSDQQALELAIIENVQRHDISALDAAVAYKRLAQEFGLSQEKIARRVGKSRPSIANTLRLLDLPPEAQQAIQDGAISEGHGRAILLAPGEGARRAALRAILRGRLSVRQAEEIAGRIARQAARDAQALQTPTLQAPGTSPKLKAAGGARHGAQGPQQLLSDEALRAGASASGRPLKGVPQAEAGAGERQAAAPEMSEHELSEHEDARLEQRLQRALSCRVQVKRRRAGGQIVLFAPDAEQLERLAQLLASK